MPDIEFSRCIAKIYMRSLSKIILNGRSLVYGKDFTVVETSYKNNKKVGTASVVIQGIGSYSGTKTVSFKIVKSK